MGQLDAGQLGARIIERRTCGREKTLILFQQQYTNKING